MDSKKTDHVVALFDKYAQMYQEKYMSVEKYAESLNLFCSLLSNQHASILELACGPGNITQYLLTINPTLNILATDLSPEMLKLAKLNNPTIKTQSLDCRSITKLNTTFDAVVCGFGLPYISKAEALQLIADASSCLRKNGLLYLSTMEGTYSGGTTTSSSVDKNDILTTYYHEATYLIEQMNKVGFEVCHESRVSYIDDSQSKVTDLILIGKLV